MNVQTPHYMLRSEASRTEGLGRWRFILRQVDGSDGFEAEDIEPDVWGERLDLLTILRALESLDRPSRVTLIGCTRYVEQGIQFGVPEWRDNGWKWEYFGRMVPVRDSDLWQRMDHVLQYHQVECGWRRMDAAHCTEESSGVEITKKTGKIVNRIVGGEWLKYTAPLLAVWCGLWMHWCFELWQRGWWGKALGVRG